MFETQLASTIKILGYPYVDAIVYRKGSQWNEKHIKSIEDILSLGWQEIMPPEYAFMSGCRYFRIEKEEIGFQQVADLRGYNFPIEFNEGSHGLELVGSKPIPKTKVNFAHLILGQKDGEEIMFTAYPGEIFASIKAYPGLSVSELRNLNIPFAVKNCLQNQ